MSIRRDILSWGGGGVCDITSKNRLTKRISYKWGNGDDLWNHLVGSLTKAHEKFIKYFPVSYSIGERAERYSKCPPNHG